MFFVWVILNQLVFAQDSTRVAIDQLMKVNQDLNQPVIANPICETCTPQVRELSPCEIKMASIYSDKTAQIHIFIGYNDFLASNGIMYTSDQAIRSYIIAELKKPCSEKEKSLCGFLQSGDDADVYTKLLADGSTVKIKLEASALSIEDRNNRASAEQKLRSAKVQNAFAESLKKDEITFYLGHSRKGGGPDFLPARLIPGTSKVDYLSYLKTKSGQKLVLSSLKNSSSEIYGAFSCDSEDHFAAGVRQASPKVTFIASTKLLQETFEPNESEGQIISSQPINGMLEATKLIIEKSCAFDDAFRKKYLPIKAFSK